VERAHILLRYADSMEFSQIRVCPRDELKARILQGIDEMNRAPTVMRWKPFGLGIA
jgi:hypothetical protein